MHHKRGKPKKSRAGCLLCKPHKTNGANKLGTVSKRGFAKVRADRSARQDLAESGDHAGDQSSLEDEGSS